MKAEPAVHLDDAGRRLVGEHDGSGMPCQPLGEAHLIVPPEAILSVLGELDIVGRVGVDEVVRLERDPVEIETRELPVSKDGAVGREVGRVVDLGVLAEGNVELALPVEAAEAVIASAVEIVEEFGRLAALGLALADQPVEPLPVGVVDEGVVVELQRDAEASLQPAVEVDDVDVHVVGEGSGRSESQGDGDAAAERLHEPPMPVLVPQRAQIGEQPALAAGPLEGRLQGRASIGRDSGWLHLF